jgi:hypothetical protein
MTTSVIKIAKDDLRNILTTLDRFPDITTNVTIVQDNSSGIGYRLEVLFDTTVNGIPGVFKVDLTDESKW